MKLLLTTLNTKYAHSNLALKYLFASAAEYQKHIHIFEFTINHSEDYVFMEILSGEYDIVCFSCYIWNVEKILVLSENLKMARPDLQILLGGPEVSFDPIPFLSNHKFVDYILTGEGEISFPQFVGEMLSEEPKPEKIRGLVYRMEGKIYVNPPALEMSMEAVPFPYQEYACERDKILYYESSRGCPYRCSYCLSALDKTVRALPLDRVKSELDYFIRQKVKQVKFVDRTFNWDLARAKEILRYLIQQDNGVTNFHFELAGDLMDEEWFWLLKKIRPGLFQFEIGVQSTNQQALAACNRKTNFSRLTMNVKKLMSLGNLHLHLDLIAGLPHEGYSSFRQSFNDVYRLGAHHLQLGFLKLLKGSPIREQTEVHGYVYRENAPYEVIANRYLSAEALVRLKRIENVLELYHNRGGFSRTIAFAVANLAETPFDFYEELSSFYYLKGFQHKAHKKEDLYRIFLAYGLWKDRFVPDIKEKMTELLTADMEATLNQDAVKKFNRKGWAFV